MFQKLPNLNFPLGEETKPPYMFVLADTRDGLNLRNIDYHKTVAEHHPNFVLKFYQLIDLEYVYQLNISGVDRGK